MKHLVSFLEGVGVALLGQAPAIAASPAVQHFIAAHPADAAYVPVAVGVANLLYQLLKPKLANKAGPSKLTGCAGGPAAVVADRGPELHAFAARGALQR